MAKIAPGRGDAFNVAGLIVSGGSVSALAVDVVAFVPTPAPVVAVVPPPPTEVVETTAEAVVAGIGVVPPPFEEVETAAVAAPVPVVAGAPVVVGIGVVLIGAEVGAAVVGAVGGVVAT